MNLLLISTTSCILEYIVPIIVEYIITYLYLGKKCETELRSELITLKREIAGISMVDEFSKYAKLQRKYNKLEDALKEKINERMSNRKKVKFIMTSVFRILNGILVSVLLYLYSNEPVIKLPKGILWPLNNILRWPTEHEDAISLIMWFLIARLAISKCKRIHISNNS